MRKRKIIMLLLIGWLVPFLAIAQANSKRVTLRLQNATVKVFFDALHEQSGMNFVYNNEQAKELPPITINVKNATVKEVLDKVLATTPFSYSIDNNTVTLQKVKNSRGGVKTLKGRVVDANGEPLPGVNIQIEGTSRGCATNFNGDYTLSVPEQCRLVVSFIGMETQTLAYNGEPQLNITMNEDSHMIGEVVVDGYFTRKTEGFAGAVTTIKKEDLQKVHTGNIFTTLSALDAGFKITENNLTGSNPNSLPDFTIRGRGSFQEGSSAPLFILDGFETTAQKVYDMDVNRIESITILKDASATILYGSRAANGVVVIETVKPKPGQLRVTYDFKPTIAIADLTDYDLMNASEKLEYERLAGLYDAVPGDLQTTYTRQQQYYRKYKNILEGVDTDWLAQPVTNSFSHTHSILVEGGAENVLYSIDGYFDQNKGVMKESGRNRYGLGFSLQYRIKDKIIIRNYASYSNTHAYDSPYGSYSTYASANPYERPWNSNGELAPTLTDGSPNPLYEAALPNRSFSDTEYFADELSADWIIGNGWRVIGQFRIEKGNTGSEYYRSPLSSDFLTVDTNHLDENGNPTYTPVDLAERGEISLSDGGYLNYSGKLTVNYNRQFNKHMLFFGGGAEINQQESDSHGFTATGFADDRYSDPAFAIQYLQNSRPSSNESTVRSIGLLANFNYIYDDRYFLDLSGRYDGSSQFGADKRWAPFWSVGGGWNVHKEHFWSSGSVLDLLKIRASYGVTGNQEFSAYQAKTMYQYQTGRLYNQLIPATLMGYGNPDLKWQNQYSTNIGFDLGLWKNRLSVTFNYYWKRTDGMLTTITVAPSLGFPSNSFTSNLGEIKNRGWELNIGASILRDPANDLEWRVNVQASQNRNKLSKINNALRGLNDQNNQEMKIPGAVYEEGESMSAIKAVPSLGIDPATGQEIYVKKDGTLTYEWDAADKVLCGDTEPDVYGNISTNLYWKGWNLNAIFQYSLGGDSYNSTLAQRVEGANPSYNADRRVLNDRWTTPGQHALYRNIRDYGQTYISTRFVQRNNYLDFTSLSLSYDFPKKWIQPYKISTLRLSFYANDLFHLSSIKMERGLDYPFARSFVFGLNISI